MRGRVHVVHQTYVCTRYIIIRLHALSTTDVLYTVYIRTAVVAHNAGETDLRIVCMFLDTPTAVHCIV